MRSTHLRLTLLSSLIMLVSLMANAHAQQAGGDRAAEVIVAPIAFDARTQRVEAVGNAEAVKSVIIYPAVGDIVTAIHFRAGDHVEEGDMLIELDSRRQRNAVSRATIELEGAERTVARLRASRERDAIPQSDLDDVITIRDLAEVELREAEVNLADRFVRAPFAGIVGITDISIGDRISANTIVTTIDARDQLYINFQAPETALGLLQSNDTVTAFPWQTSGESLTLEIADIDSRIDPSSRTIRVRALLNNESDQFRPGMSFRVNLHIQGERYAVIPEAALMWGAEGAFVWRVADGKAERVDVEIQQRQRGQLLVSGTLTSDDFIVVEGVQSLRPGQSLSILNAGGDDE